MKINSRIHIEVYDSVYPPSDDSYLLIRALDLKGTERVLDMGCGSGIVALHMAQLGCEVTAVDINPQAVKNAMSNAEKNGLLLHAVQSNLFSACHSYPFDVITFNPPYLPTLGENIAWDGGVGGTQIIAAFLQQAYCYLKKNGHIYMVTSSLTDCTSLVNEFGAHYSFEIVAHTHIFFETLYVYRITQKGMQECA